MNDHDPVEPPNDEPVEIPLDGNLDLHLFRPSDARDVVREYLKACQERGVLDVHVIHGKGTGALRRSIHALLSRMNEVEWYRTADEANGGWGATVVRLRPR